MATRDRFVEHLKSEPCLVCGRYGVDMAHLLAPSKRLRSGERPRDWGTRSHKGVHWYFAIPLCKECHAKQHALGEKWLDEQLPGGRAFAYAVALRLLAEVVENDAT